MRLLKFQKGGVYHVYNRGNRKRRMFFDVSDRVRFLNLLGKYPPLFLHKVLGYCLMPNHFHFVVCQCSETTVSVLMNRVDLAYTKYINSKYQVVGHVFQGVFQATNIPSYDDLLNVVEYIRSNPVRAGLVRDSLDYRWLWVDPRLDELWDSVKEMKL